MLFNSVQFLVFFPIVTLLFFLLPHRWRWALLLGASCYFYMAFVPIYILILGFTIVIDYFAGIWIENAKEPQRKLFLTLSLVANIGVLAIFKYYNFLNENLTHLIGLAGKSNPIPYLEILLPIGLSFHTFQAMSYTIEVYRGNQKAERHFGIYSLYVMFYPQLVAGPIERPQNILHQFYEVKKFNYQDARDGLFLMTWGLIKKVVIADRLAAVVGIVYHDPTNFQGLPLIIATLFFCFQIYCDFSGYSDIALGAAQVMGFKLMLNFNSPYSARNISDFWGRWHISLSTWFRDYLYIPLGGNRVAKWKWVLNLFIVFMVSGIWHGANWTFIVWGALHGLFNIVSILTKSAQDKFWQNPFIKSIAWLRRPFDILTTFLLVGFAWIFFRANSISDASYITTHLFEGIKLNLGYLKASLNSMGLGLNELMTCLLVIVCLEIFQYFHRKKNLFHSVLELHWIFRWPIYYAVLYIIVKFGVWGEQQFIYFQF